MLIADKSNFCQQVALAFARDDLFIRRSQKTPEIYGATVAVVYAATEASLEKCKTKEGLTELATLLQVPCEKLQEILQPTPHAPDTQESSSEKHSLDSQGRS